MMHNYEAWREYIEHSFIPELDRLELFYRDRIAPCFEELEKKADKEAEKAWNREMTKEVGDVESADPSEVAEDVFEESLDWYLTNQRLGQKVNGLFCVAVWSQVEKLLGLLFKTDLMECLSDGTDELQPRTWGKVLEAYKKKGINLRELDSFPEADALRLVNNVVKHGAGSSLDELSKNMPTMVSTVFSNGMVDMNGLVEKNYVVRAFAAARRFVQEVVRVLK